MRELDQDVKKNDSNEINDLALEAGKSLIYNGI